MRQSGEGDGRRVAFGSGAVLVALYAILALAATARSTVQIVRSLPGIPLPYVLSAVSAVVYLLATVALTRRGRRWFGVAVATISFELVGVVVVGVLSVVWPVLSASPTGRSATVWTWFGAGYGFVPLVLPVVGLLWLRRHRPEEER